MFGKNAKGTKVTMVNKSGPSGVNSIFENSVRDLRALIREKKVSTMMLLDLNDARTNKFEEDRDRLEAELLTLSDTFNKQFKATEDEITAELADAEKAHKVIKNLSDLYGIESDQS